MEHIFETGGLRSRALSLLSGIMNSVSRFAALKVLHCSTEETRDEVGEHVEKFPSADGTVGMTNFVDL